MNAQEAIARLDKLARERAALEASYGDLQTEFANPSPPDDPRERVRELVALLKRMGNYIEMEREQNAEMFALLQDAYERLVEAYKD